MMKVLWLVSWYPMDSDPFSGDFIKRHAEAVSVCQPLELVYVGKFVPGFYEDISINKIARKENKNLNENILYYPNSGNGNDIFSKIRSFLNYFRKHKEFIRQLRENDKMPDIIHVQVAMKAGLIALYIKWRYKIPYVLTEHWTGYYTESADSLFKKSYFYRYFTRVILRNASRFLPVSEALGNQIKNNWIDIPFQKIPNVVDTNLFFPDNAVEPEQFRFIHISSLIYQKNPEGIIRSFISLLSEGFRAELVLIGPINTTLKKMIDNSFVPKDKIVFLGELPYERVGIELRKSSALVMFSFYENMPCVILEALCTGIPVIATRVGGIPEVVTEENGILIDHGNEKELLQAMKKMIERHRDFRKVKISESASALFSYRTVGKQIEEVYYSVLNRQPQL